MLHKAASLALFIGLLNPASGAELIWSTLPLAGVAELKDGHPTEGVAYDLQLLLEKALPGFQHHYIVSTPNRLRHEMARGVPRCSTILLQSPELEQVGYFIPYIPALPIQLVVRTSMQNKLPIEDGQVSLAKILQNPEWRGAIAEGRGYPIELQSLLDQGLTEGHITAINSPASGTNFLSMISHGRLDYSLEYSLVVNYYAAKTKLPEPLTTLSIVENNQMSPAGIYCTKSPWGKETAAKLDQAIRQIVGEPKQILPMYRKTVTPQLYDHYEPLLRAYLEKRAQAPENSEPEKPTKTTPNSSLKTIHRQP